MNFAPAHSPTAPIIGQPWDFGGITATVQAITPDKFSTTVRGRSCYGTTIYRSITR